MARELSGPAWVERFPDAKTIEALDDGFRPGVVAFVTAMRAAGLDVVVSSTRRPVERAYLMRFSWQIFKQTRNPQNVPAQAGVDIEWVHRDATGAIDLNASRKAAAAMVKGYGIVFQPAFPSRHSQGKAIDMSISWRGSATVADKAGGAVALDPTPRNGFNRALVRAGKTYGLVKNKTDKPHWSTDGH
jgi:hypothetical protein